MKKALIASLVTVTLLNVAWIMYLAVDMRLAFGRLESPFFRACQSGSGLSDMTRAVAKEVGAEILDAGVGESYSARYAGSRIVTGFTVKAPPETGNRFVDEIFKLLAAEVSAKGCTIVDKTQTTKTPNGMRRIAYYTRWIEGEVIIIPVAREDGQLGVALIIHECRAKRLLFL
jgi:hypothetical protein